VSVWRASIVFLAVALLVGCEAPETPIAEPSPSTSPLQSPLPTSTPIPEFTAPTPQPDTGVVLGMVAVEDMDEPMAGVKVFLGEPIGSDSDAPFFGLEPSSAPGATTDEFGRFVIPSVAPGEYVILLWNPVNSVMAREPGSEEPLLLSVVAGETTDVGMLSEPRP